MNRYTAPSRCDCDHHRNRFEPAVRAALAVLDRVSEGIDVPDRDIELALQVTGDAQFADFADMRDCAISARAQQEATA